MDEAYIWWNIDEVYRYIWWNKGKAFYIIKYGQVIVLWTTDIVLYISWNAAGSCIWCYMCKTFYIKWNIYRSVFISRHFTRIHASIQFGENANSSILVESGIGLKGVRTNGAENVSLYHVEVEYTMRGISMSCAGTIKRYCFSTWQFEEQGPSPLRRWQPVHHTFGLKNKLLKRVISSCNYVKKYEVMSQLTFTKLFSL